VATRQISLVLALVLAVLTTVVVLRAKSARVHYELSGLDRHAAAIRQELREKQLELARLRNPADIRQRLQEWRGQRSAADTQGGAAGARRP
jgi:hypothetical protein